MILDDFKLDGKVAVVTGAATGLGQGMAVGLAEAGADIVGIVHHSSAEGTAERVRAAGREFLALQADLESIDPIQDTINKAEERFGHLDILVNNAGIIRREKAETFSVADWDAVMNVNLKTLFFFTQAFAKGLISSNRKGKIINVCSMLSYSGGILVAPYTASKSAVAGLTRILANEWAKYGINVNGIAPGYMATANTAPLRADEGRNKEILSRIPLDRWGLPEDLKGAAVYLASTASDYVTSTILRVDGGWLTR